MPAANVTVTITGETVAVHADTVSGGFDATMTSPPPYGSMIYDAINPGPPNPPGGSLGQVSLAFHYFGGPVPVNHGHLLLLWGPDGVAVQDVPLRTVAVALAPPAKRRKRKKAAA
jgi:hypothetical protein